MLCVPTLNDELENDATPLARVIAPESAVVPSRNVTVPVGTPVVFEATVAVNITACDCAEGFSDDARDEFDPAWLTFCTSVTVCFWKLLSPE
jgi:hypothetical protein